jgi:hypothetical protein
MTVHSLWFERESPVVSKGMDLIVIPLSVKQSMDVVLQSHNHLQLNYRSYCDFVLAMLKTHQPLGKGTLDSHFTVFCNELTTNIR